MQTSHKTLQRNFVKVLTLALCLCNFGCAPIRYLFQESCHNELYLSTDLEDYLDKKFGTAGAPPRVGILPASVPTNLTTPSDNRIGIDVSLMMQVQQQLLPGDLFPIVEVFNQPEWARKKEEFYSGNFETIKLARAAGYDFIVVMSLEPIRSLEAVSVLTKVIDTDSGITLRYFKSTVDTSRKTYERWTRPFGGSREEPAKIYSNEMFNTLGSCVVDGMREEPQP